MFTRPVQKICNSSAVQQCATKFLSELIKCNLNTTVDANVFACTERESLYHTSRHLPDKRGHVQPLVRDLVMEFLVITKLFVILLNWDAFLRKTKSDVSKLKENLTWEARRAILIFTGRQAT